MRPLPHVGSVLMPSSQTDSPRRISRVEDIARHLEVSKDTIYRWVGAQRLPAHKVGRFWKFKLQEIDDWVRADGAAEAGQKAEEGL